MQNKWIRVLFCLITIVVFMFGCKKTETEKKITREIFAMDTIMQLTIYGDHGEEAMNEAIQLVNRLDRLFSVTNKESEISKINSSAGKAVLVSKETYELIEESLQYSEDTKGAFDISIYPLVKAWGFTTEAQKVPNDSQRKTAMKKVDFQKIQCLPKQRIKIDKGMEIDLGAIAKGYLSQKIMELWKQKGVTSAIVSLGGNVQTIGKKPDGSSYQVGITNPEDGTSLFGAISVENKAIVTSGIYQRNFEENGEVYHHIMDAASGMPAKNNLASVTIITDNGVRADALATALFVMGEEQAIAYQNMHPEIELLLIRKDGTYWASKQVELI